ncbi:hypothetical protein NB710_002808 [Xanthomonas sacchari]|nr:hypothetical protein [Xanthomonas sacchari]
MCQERLARCRAPMCCGQGLALGWRLKRVPLALSCRAAVVPMWQEWLARRRAPVRCGQGLALGNRVR